MTVVPSLRTMAYRGAVSFTVIAVALGCPLVANASESASEMRTLGAIF